jgi:hypothetical protein
LPGAADNVHERLFFIVFKMLRYLILQSDSTYHSGFLSRLQTDLPAVAQSGKETILLVDDDPSIRDFGQAQEALKSGARGFIGKPYRIEDMLAAIRKVVDPAGSDN